MNTLEIIYPRQGLFTQGDQRLPSLKSPTKVGSFDYDEGEKNEKKYLDFGKFHLAISVSIWSDYLVVAYDSR